MAKINANKMSLQGPDETLAPLRYAIFNRTGFKNHDSRYLQMDFQRILFNSHFSEPLLKRTDFSLPFNGEILFQED
jgi:hypothetical protein